MKINPLKNPRSKLAQYLQFAIGNLPLAIYDLKFPMISGNLSEDRGRGYSQRPMKNVGKK
ncbi:MAG: hypothetical protein JGK30_07205 [Microcoleus sp. PH2017_40_RAT_O_B]|uniref:hypothetical protein n=1 Tax=unclassified Microcoleus TaxID=2642155 RepID=UPI001D9F197A|nr:MULTISPECIES: hypothetical protein [unclassified Microcoleus]TAG06370.1 MAG: hypothetical protein EAZ45_04860 [Oscillatoriales cyanobacterium]MCC3434367.1 hypothetical protein [Microcoleus sp. PH2017_05_CCC_O_A]MCC3570335.1 hypothetical protein [Microcoleus sp. PH2017_34_RAT_O_A]MCC3609295.1 hypothetical protein [Microcoleus sp. PH2017_40_RAT_O_B]TAG14753.1 MAG: hypothetical protein EAZ39_23445 [Oscillatoriales cyanobacterium]